MGLFSRGGSDSAPVGRTGKVINLADFSSDDFVTDDPDVTDLYEGPPEEQGQELPNPGIEDYLARVQTDGYAGKGAEIATAFLDSLVDFSQENQSLPITDLVSHAKAVSKFSQDAPLTVDLLALLATNVLLDSVHSGQEGSPYDDLRQLVARIEEKELGVSLI